MLQDILQSTLLFYGIAVLLIGDFRQILAVVRAANRLQIVAACFKKHAATTSERFGFRQFKLLHLLQYMRLQTLQNDPNATSEELQFSSYFLSLGEEKLQAIEKDFIRLLVSLDVYSKSLSDLIAWVFHNLSRNFPTDSWIAQRAILTARNKGQLLLSN